MSSKVKIDSWVKTIDFRKFSQNTPAYDVIEQES